MQEGVRRRQGVCRSPDCVTEKGQGPGSEETEDEVGSEAGTRGWNVDTWLWRGGHGQLLGSEHNVSLGLPGSVSTPNTCMSLNRPA